MQTDTLSANLGSDNPKFVKVDRAQGRVECPSCGLNGYFVELGGDVEGFSRCLSLSGGCGCSHSFRLDDGSVLSVKASETLSEGLRGSEEGQKSTCRSERPATRGSGQDDGSGLLDNGTKSGTKISAETQRGYGDSVLDEKMDNFRRRKLSGKAIAERMQQRGIPGYKAVGNCSSEINLRRWLDTGHTEVSYADWCQKRILCANCERARMGRAMSRWIPKIVEALKETDSFPWFVTVTIKDGPDLPERLEHLFGSLQTINQRRRDHEKGRKSPERAFNRIRGAIWHAEIKRGAGSGEWHPHLHGLCLVPRGVDLTENMMHNEWFEVTKDSHQVKPLLSKFGRYLLMSGETVEQAFDSNKDLLMQDLCEILKYCLKFDGDTSADDIIDAAFACRRKHLARSWGTLRNVKVNQDLKTAGVDLSGSGEYIDYIYKWCDARDSYDMNGTHRGIAVDTDDGLVDTPF